MSESAERKQRSLARLKSEGVPVFDALPEIETEEETLRRTTEQVARRAMALCLVSVKAMGMDQDVVEEVVADYGIVEDFSPDELVFILDPEPGEAEEMQFSWRIECYWTLLWALGFVKVLAMPDEQCDVEEAVSHLRDNGHEAFLSMAKLRPQSELLDEADLIYRYHWAVSDAELNDREIPGGLDDGVVMERHHALNWLIGYDDDAPWDEVTTDT